jgi:type IV pilus assembly protein PilC
MPVFNYTARTLTGELQSGSIDLPSHDDVVAHLRKNRMIVVKVQQAPRDIKFSFGKGIATRDIVIFTRQFATMINSGLPLVQALDILAEQTENKALKDVTRSVVYDVESGHTLADALRKHPKAYSELYVNMVAAGEAGGIQDTILNRLAGYIEKTMALKKKVKGAMVYPSVIMGVAVAVVALMMLFVIPSFAKMFTEFGGQLPAPTRIVMTLSDFFVKWWWLLLILIIGPIIGMRQFYQTSQGREIFDRFFLKLPVVGLLIRKVAVAKFTRTLSTLITSGIPILEGMDIVARTAGNKVIEHAIIRTKNGISEGKTIAEPLKATNVFPPMVVQMISVGEASGALDTMLGKIADFYDEEVDTAVGGLTAMLEPMLMVFLGVVLGFIVVAMYLPVFKLASTIG